MLAHLKQNACSKPSHLQQGNNDRRRSAVCGKMKGESMTRPKKEENLQHRHQVMIRFNDVEYELIKRYAKQTGYPVAVYVRKCSLGETPQITYNIVADLPEIQKLAEEFGKIGNNLNQIAKFFHMGGARSLAMQNQISQCITELHDLREEVIRMAGDFHGDTETHRS